jgi:hypothetical protein
MTPEDVPHATDAALQDSASDSAVDANNPPAPDVPVVMDVAVSGPTWHGQIAPLVAQHCAECHSAGGVAPFVLNSYADAFARHRAMANSVTARTMPPFMPGGTCQEFRDDRRLTDSEIALIREWSASGAPEGTPAPPPPVRGAPQLEWVDQVLDIGGDFMPRGVDGPLDQWWCFAMDPQLTESRVLVGYEFLPTVRGQVHHAGIVEAPTAAARAVDDAEPGLGWRCSGNVGVGSGRVVGSWAGGFGAVKYPAGTGLRLNPGQSLAVQIHYRLAPDGSAQLDRTRLRLQYARAPVPHETEYFGLGVQTVTIPARTMGFSDNYTVTMPTTSVIRAAQPHMHGLGRSIRVELVQGERRTCILNIPQWNYHWEEMHFYRDDSIVVPAGSTLALHCVWDNPNNHSVVGGLTFEDEMCDVALLTTPM